MRKRPFVLLEILIATGIVTICFTLLFSTTSTHLKKQMHTLKLIEVERLAGLTYFDCLYQMASHGTFSTQSVELDSSQLIFKGRGLKRNISTKSTNILTDRNGSEWKKLTFTVHYPELKIKMRYPLIIHRQKILE